MSGSMSNEIFIVHGMHITENLEHHKASDVKRILEDKGFEPGEENGGEQHYEIAGNPETGKHTRIEFDEQGFVKAENGVVFN